LEQCLADLDVHLVLDDYVADEVLDHLESMLRRTSASMPSHNVYRDR